MKILVWEDRREPSPARALIETGQCQGGTCTAWSVSISNGEIGMTARFESQAEFEQFLATGELHERSGE